MPREVVNPFQTLPLYVPKNEWDAVRRFTTTFRPEDGSEPEIDKSPFRRYVDLWWAGMCVGVLEGRRTEPDEWHRFNDGVVLTNDPWRIFQLEMLAIAIEGPDALKTPANIIKMANEYAAAGIPKLIQVMTGTVEPIWAVSRYFAELAGMPQPPVEAEPTPETSGR